MDMDGGTYGCRDCENKRRELEQENARLALKIQRMKHEQQERSLQRVLDAVDDQKVFEQNYAVVLNYVNGAGVMPHVARTALQQLWNYVFKGHV